VAARKPAYTLKYESRERRSIRQCGSRH